MKSKIKGIIIVLVIIIATGYYSVIDKNQPIYNLGYDTSEYIAMELIQNGSVSEKFVCKEDSIDGMSFKMNENAGSFRDSILIGYELWDVSEDKCLIKGDTDIKKLKSGRFFNIKFDRISGCKDKEYLFRIIVKACEGQSGVNVYYTQGVEDATELTYDDNGVDGTWVVRTITHRFDLETFIVTFCFILYIILFMKALYRLFG